MPKKRPSSSIKVENVLHIFCEGEKTEPIYIKGFVLEKHPTKRNVIVVEDTKKNTPIQLVDEAIKMKNSGTPNGDEFWVVFDRESTTKYSHANHLKAKMNADAAGIKIAFSNVCIEVWLLAHFTNSATSYSSYSDLKKNSRLITYMKSVGIHNYDKANPDLYKKLSPLVNAAITNAQQINNTALAAAQAGKTSPCYLNPYTNVHELLNAIQNFK